MVEDSEVDTRDETGNDDAPTASHNASASAYSVRGEERTGHDPSQDPSQDHPFNIR